MTIPSLISDKNILATYSSLMTDEEFKKQQRYIFEKDRHRALITRALARTTLSHYLPTEPEDHKFSFNSHGKPEIVNPIIPIRFNISHTKDLIACGVVVDSNLGIDIEDTTRENNCTNIAERFFARSEVESINKLPIDSRNEKFFDYWTLKEAYIKACGLGLSMPLDKFSFNIDNKNITLSTHSNYEVITDCWNFWLLQPNKNHRLAIAVQNQLPASYNLKLYYTVPLQSHSKVEFPLTSI